MWRTPWYELRTRYSVNRQTPVRGRVPTLDGSSMACESGMRSFVGMKVGDEIRFVFTKSKPKGPKDSWFEIRLKGIDDYWWRWGAEGIANEFCEAVFWEDFDSLRDWLKAGKMAYGWIEVKDGA